MTTDGESVQHEYSVNTPSGEIFGYKIGLPTSLGISFGDEGVSINGSLGLEIGDMHVNVPASISFNPDDWVKLDMSPEVGWGSYAIGIDAGLGLSPWSNIKIGGHTSQTIENTTITQEAGVYVRTGVVYAVVVAAAAIYQCAQTTDLNSAIHMLQSYWNSIVYGTCPLR